METTLCCYKKWFFCNIFLGIAESWGVIRQKG
jgi:hypothetical protein